MFQNNRVLVVVPARGGSKGVKLKNIHPLNGKPLIAHTATLVQKLDYVDRRVVSTDHDEIADTARRCGLDVGFRRPENLSGDRIGDADVLSHSLAEMERIDDVVYDIVVMLQPTCPLRTPAHVTATVTKLVAGGWDSVWTVSRTDLKYHPLKQLCLDSEGAMTLFDPRGNQIVARQQLEAVYTRNGAAYALTRLCLLYQKTTLGRRSSAVVIDEPMVSIDTLDDFRRVESIMKNKAGLVGTKL